MIQFECILARLTDAVAAPAFAGGGAESILRNVFDSASDGDIQLLIDSSRMAAARGNRSSVSSVESTWHSANGAVCGLINAGSVKIQMIHISQRIEGSGTS